MVKETFGKTRVTANAAALPLLELELELELRLELELELGMELALELVLTTAPPELPPPPQAASRSAVQMSSPLTPVAMMVA